MSGSSTIALIPLTLMVLFYSAERSYPLARLGFAAACLVAALSDFVSGHWPFGVVAVAFGFISARRWNSLRRQRGPTAGLL